MPEPTNLFPPHTSAVNIQRVDSEQSERLLAACLRVLEDTGVRLYHDEAIALASHAGASVEDGNLVKLPPKLVRWALGTAPRSVTLYNRDGEPVMPVADRNSFFGPGSDCLYIVDHRTNARRKPVLNDVVEGVTVADALPHIDFAMSMFVPTDVPDMTVDRYQMTVLLNHTTKPIMFVTNAFDGAVDAVAMAEVVRGGADALREKPLVACYVNVTTGLIHNAEALDKLLYLSDKGLPFAYVPSSLGGATAPVTPAATLVISQAGALAGLVLSQLKREGTPLILPGWGGNMLDMRTTVQPYADPDKRLLAPDFVHYLGLPMFALAGCSDSKLVDQQAALEAALTLMTDSLTGGNIVHDLGYLESGMSSSLAQLVICNEILAWLSHMLAPIDVSDEALALDLIRETGPGGHYLGSDHTFSHFKDRFYPTLLDRNNHQTWHEAGATTLGERAAAHVDELLATHQTQPLPDDMLAQLIAIRDKARQSNGKVSA